jgi:homoaconitase/3-isopropylmalate dehydratase large subunit
MGVKCAIVPCDETTVNWLKGRVKEEYEPIYADENAVYERIIEYDLSDLEPQVARPHKVDNVCKVSELAQIPIDVALLGTCTNGRLDDLKIATEILDGKKIAKDVRLLVYPASKEVLLEAIRLGYIEKLILAGGEIGVPACGPCLGAYGGVLAPGEKCISTANRNFKGRMGCKENTEIYLASPATVAASSIAGEITSK